METRSFRRKGLERKMEGGGDWDYLMACRRAAGSMVKATDLERRRNLGCVVQKLRLRRDLITYGASVS